MIGVEIDVEMGKVREKMELELANRRRR